MWLYIQANLTAVKVGYTAGTVHAERRCSSPIMSASSHRGNNPAVKDCILFEHSPSVQATYPPLADKSKTHTMKSLRLYVSRMRRQRSRTAPYIIGKAHPSNGAHQSLGDVKLLRSYWQIWDAWSSTWTSKELSDLHLICFLWAWLRIA